MEKILSFVEKRLLPPISVLAELKHLRAIRDGIVAVLPLIILGSFFILLGMLPVDAFSKEFLVSHPAIERAVSWYLENRSWMLLPSKVTIGLMAFFASFGIAYSLAKSYKQDEISAGMISAAGFLITQIPLNLADMAHWMNNSWVLPMQNLGGKGLFAAIIISFFTVEVMRFFSKSRINFKMPEGVPPSVINAFASLLPGAVVMLTIWVIADILKIDFVGAILYIFKPLVYLGDTIWAVIFINLLMQLIWLGGIHGASVVNAVFLTVWMGYYDENVAAAQAHQVLPHVTNLVFYQWFVWVGGSGATLGLVFLLLLSRSKFLKQLGKVAVIPGICNINEPVIFGMPIIMNPILALPFITAPIISGIISYTAIWSGLVNKPFVLVPWTLPAPIGGFLATGYDWKALVLILVNLIITTAIYYPFVKAYEKQLEKNEAAESTG